MLGDDYGGFPAVKREVDWCCVCQGLRLQFVNQGRNRIWYVVKPTNVSLHLHSHLAIGAS